LRIEALHSARVPLAEGSRTFIQSVIVLTQKTCGLIFVAVTISSSRRASVSYIIILEITSLITVYNTAFLTILTICELQEVINSHGPQQP
ncbi:MAG: hypothetical protein ABFD82_13950, partial [Syntrophaceae bacterium]